MKKIIILTLLVTIAAASWGQAKPDTSWAPKSDTTEFISIADINAYLVELSGKTSLTPIEFLKFRDAATEIINRAIIRKRKPK